MFYIKIPEELISLHLLEDIVLTRLEYLEVLSQNKPETFVGNIEYLLEDSKYDSIGHFLTRLFASTSAEFFSYWLKQEALFFKYRLNHIHPRQLNRLFRKIEKDISEENEHDCAINKILIRYCSLFLQQNVFFHIIDRNHYSSCEQYHLKVDFELIPDLIQSREVELSKGEATIYCSQWKETLISLFKTFIIHKVYKEKLSIQNLDVLSDPRLISLNMQIQRNLTIKGMNDGNITFKNIDTESNKFPLCMRNLHNILRERHRLSHHARFYYTLFLKECGMKIDDVIQYWKQEYSKPHECGSICVHNWQKDENKFLYSIRHMYGLEGSKKNYKAPNCNHVCKNIPGPNFEGGCPFKNFDSKALYKLLSSYLSDAEVQTLLGDDVLTNPSELCKRFLQLSVNNVEHNFTVTSPVQYYLKSINQNCD